MLSPLNVTGQVVLVACRSDLTGSDESRGVAVTSIPRAGPE